MSEGRYYFNAFLGLISAGSLGLMLKHQIQIFIINSQRKKAFNTQEFSPTQLTEAIQCNSDVIQKFFYQTNEDIQNHQLRGRAFISGLTHTDQPIFSQFKKDYRNIPLVYKIKYDEDVYSLDIGDAKKKTYTTMNFPDNAVFQKVPIINLIDQQNNAFLSQITINNDTNVSQVLQYINSKDKFGWKTISERFIAFIIFLLKVIMQIVIGKENPLARQVRGIKLGIRETEVGIQLNSPILAYGEIIYDFATNTCRMDSPIALTNDKMQYIKQINQKLADQRYLRNFFGAIFATTAVYFARRLWHFSLKLRAIKKQDEIIQNLWEQANEQCKNKCPKLKKILTDEELVLFGEDADKEKQPCSIDDLGYNDNGRECKFCKKIYLQYQEKVLREETKKDDIISNKKQKK